MTSDASPENRLLAEETVRPFSAVVPLILWGVTVIVLAIIFPGLFKPMPDFVPDWMGILNGAVDTLTAVFVPLILLTLSTVFTVIWFMFRGTRYRVFPDRIEFQYGKYPHLLPFQRIFFGERQTLAFSEVDSICWQPDNKGGSRWASIGFHFATRTFQFPRQFDMSGHVAEACRTIERDIIAPKIHAALEAGETVTFKPPGVFSRREIHIDREKIQDWNQSRLACEETISWNQISMIRFSTGDVSRYGHFLVQSRIHVEDILGRIIEFDMPQHNPHAFWTVLTDRCDLTTVQVLEFPGKENDAISGRTVEA